MRVPLFFVVLGLCGVVHAEPPPEAAAHVHAAFGRGLEVESADGTFSLNLRARFQTRLTVVGSELPAARAATSLEVRRAQVILSGRFAGEAADYYLQLGFGSHDGDPVSAVPLRDAFVTWHALPFMDLRVGQMRVPYDRQLMTSSSALSFVDRSIVAAEFGMDRDAGIQLLRSQVGHGAACFAYHAGIFSGDGRNHESLRSGLLYLVRLQYVPWGEFDDLSEGDLARAPRPRLAIGLAAAYNRAATRERSTAGPELAFDSFDFVHLGADLMVKWRGLCLAAEFLLREATSAPIRTAIVDDVSVREVARSGFGAFAQLGYTTLHGFELALRFGRFGPSARQASELTPTSEASAGMGWYVRGHDLKLQGDASWLFDERIGEGHAQARLQFQFYL